MMAVLGAFVQAKVTNVGPIDNLFAHLADPYHTTILQSVSLETTSDSFLNIVDGHGFLLVGIQLSV